jgi:hypothetical protein
VPEVCIRKSTINAVPMKGRVIESAIKYIYFININYALSASLLLVTKFP